MNDALLDSCDDERVASAALARLEGSTDPFLVGVRHHSAACALAMDAWLDAFAPTHVALELASDLQAWVEWLSHPELVPPVALASVAEDGADLVFYPFASFSPELAAVRWARAHDVPVVAIDHPLGARAERDVDREEPPRGLVTALEARTGASDVGALWDRLVEAPSVGASPESIRRAALRFGWALRHDAERSRVSARDLQREQTMRRHLAALRAAGARVAAVVGAFHASALLAPFEDALDEGALPEPSAPARVSSLVPYAFELFDARSGYPAGVLDPGWHERLHASASDPSRVEVAVRTSVVEICRELRARGHVAGLPDAAEASRVALDLARLRGLTAPSRRELLEGLSCALGQGEPLGRGRALAGALDRVLVGHARGRLAPGTPRSGLAPHVVAQLSALGLPAIDARTARHERAPRLRLDVLGSSLDRCRKVALERLALVGVPYAMRRETEGPIETLTEVWEIAPTAATEPMIELASSRGITLAQAAEGSLRIEEARLAREERLTAGARLAILVRASEAGLVARVSAGLPELVRCLLAEGTLRDLVAASAFVARARSGHVAGLPIDDAHGPDLPRFEWPRGLELEALPHAVVRALEGLAGSDDESDARAIAEAVAIAKDSPALALAAESALLHLARQGAPLVEGAASMMLAALGSLDPEALAVRLGSWVDAAVGAEGHARLTRRLRGALVAGEAALSGDATLLAGVADRIESIADADFLARAASLREGFDVLSPAARGRLLESVLDRHGAHARDLEPSIDPQRLTRHHAADLAARAALSRLHLDASVPAERASPAAAPPRELAQSHALSSIDRWRIVLGREAQRLDASARRVAQSLDELYGPGRGEGARRGGGSEPSFPTTREWANELEALFGEHVRDEVLSRAGALGRAGALFELDAERVTPSIELLETVLSLKGGLGEAQLGRLRRLVERITRALVDELATRVRPALTGLATCRPTSRPGGPVDLARTIARNLATARRVGDAWELVPERLVFQTRARRSMDWRVILVVDVSGSMEPSVIYSAMMASILGALPAIRTSFVAFSTEVMDLTDRVADPLGLLLEIRVGGGTDIAKALRYARSLVEVPARTMVLVVSDLEEGGPVGALLAEVRALAESGVTVLGLAALDDEGRPRFERTIAEQCVSAGMPVAALSPLELARWIGERVR